MTFATKFASWIHSRSTLKTQGRNFRLSRGLYIGNTLKARETTAIRSISMTVRTNQITFFDFDQNSFFGHSPRDHLTDF